MTTISDPQLRRVERELFETGLPGMERRHVERQSGRSPVRRHPFLRAAAYTAVSVAAVIVTLSAIATLLSAPLSGPEASSPSWSVELSSAGHRPVTVLAYGREAGIHLLRVPPASSPDQRRVVSARLAAGELHLLSLGLSSLRVRTSAPPGSGLIELGAEGRTVTIFQSQAGTGVRAGW